MDFKAYDIHVVAGAFKGLLRESQGIMREYRRRRTEEGKREGRREGRREQEERACSADERKNRRR